MIRNAPNSANVRSGRSRYPGTGPFNDTADDHKCFFGRNEEGEQLYLRVLSVPLVVQFGKSGYGKTSLLQAYLFPRLRQKSFLPVMVRLNVAGDTLTVAVAGSIQHACKAEGLEFNEVQTDGLWELLWTTTVWRDDLLLTPVLVFDQFEEVFTFHDATFRANLAAELGALASGVTPKRFHTGRSGVPEQFAAHPNVKVVISLREDYLGALEEFSASIPNLFHERLRLEPLTERAAREAITGPARLTSRAGEEPYWAPCFDFEASALDSMITYLRGSSRVIEPFQLQLLCRHAEAIARSKGSTQDNLVKLTLADFNGSKGFDAVLKNFYRNTLLNLDRSQRKRAKQMCEEGLLDASGHRLMLEEGQIRREFRITTNTLVILSQERLLRRERRLESAFYEISHDRLAESILRAKRFRLPKRWRSRLWTTVIVAPVIVFGLLFWALSLQMLYNDLDMAYRRADLERRKAEHLLGFLLGEKFLGVLRETGHSKMLEQVQKQVEISGNAGDQSPALLRGLALRNDGDLKRIHGYLRDSAELFSQALHEFEISSKDVNQRETARTNNLLGEVLADQGLVTQALSHYEAAVETWHQVVAGASTVATEDCTSLADSLMAAGELKNRMGDLPGALTDLQKALRITFSVLFPQSSDEGCPAVAYKAEPYPDAKALEVLTRGAILAQILGFQQNFEGDWALAMQANRLNPHSISARKNAVVVLAYLGNELLPNDPQRALDEYRDALDQSLELLHWDPDNQLWQRERAAIQLLISEAMLKCRESKAKARNVNVCKPMPSLNEAKTMTLEAIATLRILAQNDPINTSWQQDLAWALSDYTHALAAAGQQKERLATLKEVERILNTSSPDKMDAEAVEKRAELLGEKADALAKLGRQRDAEATLEEFIDWLRTLIADHQNNLTYLGTMSLTLHRKAEILRKTGNTTGAAAADREKKSLDEHYNTLFNNNSKQAVQLSKQRTEQINNGANLSKRGDYTAALSQFYAAESTAREYILVQPTASNGYKELSKIYWWIDNTLLALETHDKERYAPLIRWMYAAQVAAWLTPEESQLEILDKARLTLAVMLYNQGRLNESLVLTQEAIVIDEALVRGAPQGSSKSARYLSRLANANVGIGKNRRENDKTGWEEPIRSALIQFQEAADIDTKNPDYPEKLGDWRKYLAEQLNAEKRKEGASEELALAIEAYKEAARRAPGNEKVKQEIRDLEK